MSTSLGTICVESKLCPTAARLIWATLLALTCLGPAAAEAENYQDSIRAFVERVNEASTNFYSGSEPEARERAHTLLSWAFDFPP